MNNNIYNTCAYVLLYCYNLPINIIKLSYKFEFEKNNCYI